MRVAVISKADSFGGGASRVAEELVDALNQRGHMAIHWVSWSKKGYTPVRRRIYGELWQRRFYHWSRSCKTWFAPDIIPFEWPNLYLQNIPDNFDVVHFHDISSAVSPWTVSWFARRMPTLWTFHDCSPFTGGCLYPLACERFKDRCGQCPQHGVWPIDGRFDYSRLTRGMHAAALRSGVKALAPSRWMAEMSMASGLMATPPEVIHNGVDTRVFRPPTDRDALRQRLGLPVGRPVVLLSAASLASPYKGVRHAFQALATVAAAKPMVLVVGEASADTAALPPGIDVHFAGYLSDSGSLANHYGAADYFLCASLAENFPLAVLETMACGLPTIGFRTGGVAEIVEEGTNGRLVTTGDAPALAQALDDAIVNNRRQEWTVAAAARIQEHFPLERMVEAHLATYGRMMERSPPSKRV